MAAPKKHSSARARANKAATAATLYVAPEGGGDQVARVVPVLPEVRSPDGDVMEWDERTLEWWRDLWSSPMSAEYHESDIHQLYLLAMLYDQFWRFPSTALAAEIRLQRQSFGLTPYDRRRLEWTIETSEEAKDRGDRRRAGKNTAQQPLEADDPRLKLVN